LDEEEDEVVGEISKSQWVHRRAQGEPAKVRINETLRGIAAVFDEHHGDVPHPAWLDSPLVDLYVVHVCRILLLFQQESTLNTLRG